MSDQYNNEPAAHLVALAIGTAMASPCQSKRGAVIFYRTEAISSGYNNKPEGFACDGSAACKATCRQDAIHAEQYALLNSPSRGQVVGCDLLHVKTVNGKIVQSGGPSCVACSKLLVAAGIAGVWLYHATGWRRYDALEFHRLSLIAEDERLRAIYLNDANVHVVVNAIAMALAMYGVSRERVGDVLALVELTLKDQARARHIACQSIAGGP